MRKIAINKTKRSLSDSDDESGNRAQASSSISAISSGANKRPQEVDSLKVKVASKSIEKSKVSSSSSASSSSDESSSDSSSDSLCDSGNGFESVSGISKRKSSDKSKRNKKKNKNSETGGSCTLITETISTVESKIWICPACKKLDDGSPMIGCDNCDDWYHWDCVGIKVEPKDEDAWFCPACQEMKMKTKKKVRKV